MMDEPVQDLYCRLYVNTASDEKALREKIAGYFGGKIVMRSASDEFIDFRVTENKDFDSIAMNALDGFVHFPFTVETHPKHDPVQDMDPIDSDIDIYLDLLCHVIKELRKSGDQVVASCEFEDLVAKRTGWNWSKDTPHHP